MSSTTASLRVDLCSRGCYVASLACDESELQRYSEPATHRVSDEGEPCDARAGDAQGLGGDAPLPADSEIRSEEHTSELQSLTNLVCRLLLEQKKVTDSPTLHEHAG